MAFDKEFNTILSPDEAVRFTAWKQQYAPHDSGDDYDLRGAFKAGLTPDATTGHWQDTFKKPNHPTFSDQSQYSSYGKPGTWQGETYIPHKEAEEFEFRARAEAEAQTAPPVPSTLAVAGNAAAKGLASVPDFLINAGTTIAQNQLSPIVQAGRAAYQTVTGQPVTAFDRTPAQAPNLARKALEKAGIIRTQNEPQTGPQRILDTAIQAGVNTALSPASSLGQVAVNVGMGLVSGGAAGLTKEVTGSDLAATAVGMLTPLGLSRAYAPGTKSVLTQEGDDVLAASRQAGYVVQPSSMKPSFSTSKAEWVAGSGAIRNDAALKNQPVTNDLAAQAIGLPKGTQLTDTLLKEVREQAAAPYREVASLSREASTTLDALKQTRADATAQYNFYKRTADPATLDKARTLTEQAERLERKLELIAVNFGKRPPTVKTQSQIMAEQADSQLLKTQVEKFGVPPKPLKTQSDLFYHEPAGRPELVNQLRESRKLIAKTYDVEHALLEDGNVSASILGRMLENGKPLSGELKVIGKFAKTFPYAARDQRMIPPPESSATNLMVSGLLGGAGAAATGGVAGVALGALPLLRSPMRSGLLSNAYQNRLLREPASYNIAAIRGGLVGKSLLDYHDEVLK